MGERSTSRRVGKISALILVALATVAAGSFLALRLYLSEERVQLITERQASRAVAGELEVGAFEWLRFPSQASVSNLSLRDPTGEVVLEVEHATFTVDPLALATRTVRIGELEASGVTVRLISADTEGYTITEALASPDPAPDPGPPWDVVVDRADIRNADIEIETDLGVIVVTGVTFERLSLRWEGGTLHIDLDALVDQVSLQTGLGDVVATDLSLEGLQVIRSADEEIVSADLTLGSARRIEAAGVSAALPRASGRFEAGELEIREAVLNLLPGLLSLSGTAALAPASRASLALTLQGVEPPRTLGAWIDPSLLPARIDGEASVDLLFGPELEGTVVATLQLAGIPAALSELAPPALVDELPAEATLELSLSARRDGLVLEALELRARDLVVSAAGEVPIEREATLAVSFEVEHSEPGRLLTALDWPVSAASVMASGRIGGTLDSPAAAGAIEVAGAGVLPLPGVTGDLALALAFEDDILELIEGRLESAAGSATATGTLRLRDEAGALAERADVTARLLFREWDLAILFPEWPLEGLAAGELRASGTLAEPRAVGQVAIAALALGPVPFDTALASISMDTRRLRLTGLALEPVPGGEISGSASLAMDGLNLLVDIVGTSLPAALLTALFDESLPASGLFTASLQVTGTLRDPAVEAELTSPDLRLADIRLDRLSVTAAGGLDAMDIALFASADAGDLEATGTILPRDREIASLRVLGSDLAIAALPWTGDLPFQPAGRGSVDLHLRGSLPFPEVTGQVAVDELTIDGREVHRGRLVARVGTRDDATYAVGIGLPGAVFVRALVRTDPAFEIEATADIDRFRLGWLIPALPRADVDVVLSGEGEAHFRALPFRLEASLNLPSLDVSIAGAELSARQPVSLRFDSDVLIVDTLDLTGPAGSFRVGGAIGPEVLDLIAFGNFDAALIAAFLPQVVRSSGNLLLDVRATGTPARPLLDGRVDLFETLRLLPRGMLREVEVQALGASLRGNNVLLEVLAGRMGGGAFQAEGSATLDGLDLDSIELTIFGSALPFRAGDLTGDVDLDLRLTSFEDSLLLSGLVNMVRGRYVRELSISGFSLIAEDPVAPQAEPPELFERLDLDVRVVSPGTIDVRASAGSFGVELMLDADLVVSGTAASPRIAGRIEALRGWLRTPRAELPIVRAIADFVPTPTEPVRALVDIAAEGEVVVPTVGLDPFQPAHFVTIVLEGEADELSLDLASQPPLDRLEILSLLVTGRVVPRLVTPGDQRHVESAIVFAGTRLAEPLTAAITDRLEDVLNLDLLVADVTAQGIAITAGAEVTRRLRLEGALQQGFGDTGAMALARARFLLSNTVSLEASSRATGEGGTGVVQAEREGRRSTLEIRARVLGGG